MEWYYAGSDGQQVTFDEAEFPQLVSSGKIEASTLVWTASMSDWQKASLAKPEHFVGASSSQVSPYMHAGSGTSADQRTVGAQPVYTEVDPTQGLQTASLICGILSVTCLGILSGIPAVICGHMARSKKADLNAGSTEGTGMALAGLIMGYLCIVGTVLYGIILISASFMGY